ncbi:MAG: YihY/virulence factor BrkB family protein [Acidimicrobiia bacterium]
MRTRLGNWFAIANDVRIESRHDHVVIIAAGVAFYAVLALLPAMFIAVSLYGLFTNTTEAERQIELFLAVLPESATLTLSVQMRSIAAASQANLSFGFLASTAALIWTVSSAIRAMVGAVKIAYNQEEERSIFESRAVAMALTVFVIIGTIIALAAVAAVPAYLQRIDPTDAVITLGNVRWIAIGAGVLATIGFLYRYAPPTRPEGWRDVLPGAILATGMWFVASIAFSAYVSSFANYNATYGTLGGGVILLLWFWLSALAVILGAEFNETLVRRRTA